LYVSYFYQWILCFLTSILFLLIFFALEALRRAEERADALDAKLKLGEKSREKAEKEAAAVEGLRQRLQTAEDTLSDKVAQQIERKYAIVTRLETQNRRFTSNPLLLLPFCFCFCLFL
jgi:uncharacterized protein YlxW (UPF0749 family)